MMSSIVKKRAKKPGTSPGTLVHVGEKRVEKVSVHVINYGVSRVIERDVASAEEAFSLVSEDTVTWIDVDGVHDVALIDALGKAFNLHPLLLEDVVSTHQRPKVDDYGDAVYIVCRMLRYKGSENVVCDEQFSIVLGKNFVISFQEGPGDVLDAVRGRIRGGKGRIRRMGSDYLAYALLDSIVDHYFVIVEKFGDEIEKLERQMIGDPRVETLRFLYHIKREMIFLRKAVWPLREVLNSFLRDSYVPVTEAVNLFFHDVYDHTVQVMDTIESCRDLLSGMIDIYMSSVSNKMNAVMKVLTVISTVFMPLTLVTGIYGMNFEDMPELHWRYGYPATLLAMGVVATGSWLFFRRKKWLS